MLEGISQRNRRSLTTMRAMVCCLICGKIPRLVVSTSGNSGIILNSNSVFFPQLINFFPTEFGDNFEKKMGEKQDDQKPQNVKWMSLWCIRLPFARHAHNTII